MQEDKIEHQGKNFTISLDLKQNIIFLVDWGGVDEVKADEMKRKILEFTERIPPTEPVRLMVEAKKFEKITPKARKIFFSLVKRLRDKKTKIALITLSPTVRLVGRFIGYAIKDFKTFSTKQEGIKWLKNQKVPSTAAKK